MNKPEIFIFRDPSIQAAVEARRRLEVARTVLWHEGKTLLIQRKGTHFNGFWELPGGKHESGYDTYATAGREITEETGLIGLQGEGSAREFIFVEERVGDHLLHAIEFNAQHPLMPGSPYDRQMVITHISEAVAFSPKVTLDPQCHTQHMWIKPENALRRYAELLTPYTKFALEAVVARQLGANFTRERLDYLPDPQANLFHANSNQGANR